MSRLASIAAMIGGLIWAAAVVATALRPSGVPAAFRPTVDLYPTELVSFILMAMATTALAASLARGRLARAAVILVWLGAAVFSVNVAFVITTGTDRDVWVTDYIGKFLVFIGSGVLGVALLRRGLVPVGVAILMLVTAVISPMTNDQDERVLLWLPLGLGWVAVGVATLRGVKMGVGRASPI